MSDIEIEKTLVLSTAHVTPTTAAILNACDLHGSLTVQTREALAAFRSILKEPPPEEPPWAPQIAWEHGWIWYCGSENPVVLVDFPEEFAAIFSLAMHSGCKWVRFDCDAEVISGLPTWTW